MPSKLETAIQAEPNQPLSYFASLFGVSREWVRLVRKRMGIGPSNCTGAHIPKKRLLAASLLQSNPDLTTQEVMQLAKTSRNTVALARQQTGIREKVVRKSKLTIAIEQMIDSGKSRSEIASILGVDISVVYSAAHRMWRAAKGNLDV